MSMDPNARRRAQSFWKKVKDYVSDQISMQSEVMEVIEVTSENRLVVRSFDPDTDVSREVPHIKSVRAEVGSRVVVTTVGGHQLVTGVLREPGQVEDDSVPFSGSGSSDFAARADHFHRPNGASTEGMAIGQNAVQTLRGQAIGHAANAADASVAIGQSANASGYVSTAVGWDALASGMHGVAVGYMSDALGERSIAVGYGSTAVSNNSTAVGGSADADSEGQAFGYNSSATGIRSLALGLSATATGQESVSLGYATDVSGYRSWAIGYNADNATSDRGVLKANIVFIERSTGTGETKLLMRRPDNSGQSFYIANDDRLTIGTKNTVMTADTIAQRFPANRKVGAASAPLKSYAHDSAGGTLLPAGEEFWYSMATTQNGYVWYVAWTRYGVGYIRSDLTVAL